MKRLCYLGILKEGFSTYSSPVILISRKVTKDKRVITDFKHLNVRITKNNLAYVPKKCQLFRKQLQYMGNTIFIKESRVCVKSMQSWIKAIHITNPDYNIVIKRLHLYYDIKLITFRIDEDRNLIVQFPIFVQPYTQQPLILYQI